MNHIDEMTLALFASGDLDAQAAVDAERHLAGCMHCQALAAEFGANAQRLQSLAVEPDARDFATLTAGTLSRITARHTRRGWWLAFSGVAAAMVMGALLLAWRHLAPIPGPPAVAQLSPPEPPPVAYSAPQIAKKLEPAVAVKSVRAKAPARSGHPRLESVSLISQKDGPAILKMKTNDPNVVILWVMNDNPPKPEVRND